MLHLLAFLLPLSTFHSLSSLNTLSQPRYTYLHHPPLVLNEQRAGKIKFDFTVVTFFKFYVTL